MRACAFTTCGIPSPASARALRLGLPIIGKLLGHSQPATTARYAHLAADPMRRAVETIGATIGAALVGLEEKRGAFKPNANNDRYVVTLFSAARRLRQRFRREELFRMALLR